MVVAIVNIRKNRMCQINVYQAFPFQCETFVWFWFEITLKLWKFLIFFFKEKKNKNSCIRFFLIHKKSPSFSVISIILFEFVLFFHSFLVATKTFIRLMNPFIIYIFSKCGYFCQQFSIEYVQFKSELMAMQFLNDGMREIIIQAKHWIERGNSLSTKTMYNAYIVIRPTFKIYGVTYSTMDEWTF